MSRILHHALAIAIPLTLAACSQAPVPGRAVDAASPQNETGHSEAAGAFLSALSDSARAVALLPFNEAERTRWFFIPTEIVPQARAGLPLKRMDAPQRRAAFRLLATALSPSGYRTALAIVENEALLGRIEDAAGTRRHARDPALYFVSIFDRPSTEPWGWRFEGHHLSVNVTGADGRRLHVSPLFMGANPHRVLAGPTAGSRLLAAEEDGARELLAMLSPAQRARVIVSDTTYGEIRTRNDPRARELPQEGIQASEMAPQQQAKLRELLGIYAGRLEPGNASDQWQRIEAAGFGRLRFVWAGSTEPGKAHYYRIHGPTVLIEYDNSQNNANHSHTVWRDLENDFGGDLLRRHYQQHPH